MNWESDIMFWSANPQMKLVYPELYKNDTSRDKKKSSCYMWGLAMIYHIESSIYDWTLVDKVDHVAKYIWKDYRKEFLEMHAKDGVLMSRLDGGDTAGMRQLKEWARIMDEKSAFISTQKYGKDTWEMLEDMLESNNKLFKEYDRIMSIVMAEKLSSDTTVGKSEESLLEKGDLHVN